MNNNGQTAHSVLQMKALRNHYPIILNKASLKRKIMKNLFQQFQNRQYSEKGNNRIKKF